MLNAFQFAGGKLRLDLTPCDRAVLARGHGNEEKARLAVFNLQFLSRRQCWRIGMYDLKAWDGRPDNPERSAWHWIEDADGLRPLLWRGDDWPERMDRGEWQDGYAVLSARDLSRGRYHGPIAMSPRLAARWRRSLLLLEA